MAPPRWTCRSCRGTRGLEPPASRAFRAFPGWYMRRPPMHEYSEISIMGGDVKDRGSCRPSIRAPGRLRGRKPPLQPRARFPYSYAGAERDSFRVSQFLNGLQPGKFPSSLLAPTPSGSEIPSAFLDFSRVCSPENFPPLSSQANSPNWGQPDAARASQALWPPRLTKSGAAEQLVVTVP